MSIIYKIVIPESNIDWVREFIQSLTYFEKYEKSDDCFIFKKEKSQKYPSVVIYPKDYGMAMTDYFTGQIGREMIGEIVECVTGEKEFIKISEHD